MPSVLGAGRGRVTSNKPSDPDKLAREIRQLLARPTVELQRRRKVRLGRRTGSRTARGRVHAEGRSVTTDLYVVEHVVADATTGGLRAWLDGPQRRVLRGAPATCATCTRSGTTVRGYGRSPKPASLPIGAHVDDLLAVLDHDPAVVTATARWRRRARGGAAPCRSGARRSAAFESPMPWFGVVGRMSVQRGGDDCGGRPVGRGAGNAAERFMRSMGGRRAVGGGPATSKSAREREGSALLRSSDSARRSALRLRGDQRAGVTGRSTEIEGPSPVGPRTTGSLGRGDPPFVIEGADMPPMRRITASSLAFTRLVVSKTQ